MARYADEGGATVSTVLDIPLGGFAELLKGSEHFKPVNTALLRAEYPELDAAFPHAPGSENDSSFFDRAMGFSGTSRNQLAYSPAAKMWRRGYLYSNNGIDWNQSQGNSGTGITIYNAAAGEFLFAIGIGDIYAVDEFDPNSPVQRGSVGFTVNALCLGGGTLLAVASQSSGNRTHTSSDGGATWTAGDLPVTGEPLDCAYNAVSGLFIVVTGDGTVATSPDGQTWTERSNPHAGNSINAVCVFNDGKVIVGNKYGGLFTSVDDGDTWTQIRSPDGTTEYEIKGMAHDPTSDVCMAMSAAGYAFWARSGDTSDREINIGFTNGYGIGVDSQGQWIVYGSADFGMVHVTDPNYLLLSGDPAETRLVRVK